MMSNKVKHSETLWGIDLGGTKIECVVLVSAQQPEIIARRRVPTDSNKGYTQVLENIWALVESIAKDTGISPASIGIGTPGTLDSVSGLLRGSNSQHLQGMPIQTDLQNRLGIPVAIENDANCFALAETRMGAATQLQENVTSVFGIIMGTGVGGGLVLNNQLVSGRNSIAGEWGHNYLDASGGPCYCGKSGCVETVISGPALQRFYAEKSGQARELPEIVALAKNGDSHATNTLERLMHFFGIGVSCIVNMLDPDVIIIGGGVGNIERLYTDGVTALGRHIFSPTMHTKVIRPMLGDSAGVFGAAFLTADRI